LRKLVFIVGGLVVLGVLAVVVLIAVTLLRDDDPNLLTSAPEIPTAAATTPVASQTAAATPPSTTATAGQTTPAAAATTQPTPVAGIPAPGVVKFVIDQSGSEVKYVVREKLARLPVSSDAVGTTNQISGELFLNNQGLVVPPSCALSMSFSFSFAARGLLRHGLGMTSVCPIAVSEGRRCSSLERCLTYFSAAVDDGLSCWRGAPATTWIVARVRGRDSG